MKKVITACFIILCLSISTTSLVPATNETDQVIHDAGKKIAKRLYKRGWIITRIFAPIKKDKIIEIEAIINGEIVQTKNIYHFQYFRYHTKSKTMKIYGKGVAVFLFCGGKWRLNNIWLIDQTLCDADPELFWELYDLEPFDF